MKYNIILLSIIILFSLYHYFIHNGLEKKFIQTYFDYNLVKRPLLNCSNKPDILGYRSGSPSSDIAA